MTFNPIARYNGIVDRHADTLQTMGDVHTTISSARGFLSDKKSGVSTADALFNFADNMVDGLYQSRMNALSFRLNSMAPFGYGGCIGTLGMMGGFGPRMFFSCMPYMGMGSGMDMGYGFPLDRGGCFYC